MLTVTLTLLAIGVNAVDSLSCHSCAGAAFLPKHVSQAMTAANISTTTPVRGNCKGTTGSDVCTDGKFCVKKTVTYSIGIKGVSFNWDTYTKGCATVREDNKEVPTNTCYDISTTDKGTYKQIARHCYCSTELCNTASSFFFSAIYLVITITYFK
ncbi:hypothetical protein OSTOST_02069 [Ostertagia ostertagi]